jgi:excisionase family DNA binding protein
MEERDVEDFEFRDLPDKTLLRVNDVARFLGVSLKTIYRWYHLGEIRGAKIKGSLRIYRASIVQLLGDRERLPDCAGSALPEIGTPVNRGAFRGDDGVNIPKAEETL